MELKIACRVTRQIEVFKLHKYSISNFPQNKIKLFVKFYANIYIKSYTKVYTKKRAFKTLIDVKRFTENGLASTKKKLYFRKYFHQSSTLHYILYTYIIKYHIYIYIYLF